MNEVIILADGDFPRSGKLLDKLKNAQQIICCDGAADKLLSAGLEPTWIVGDLDSVSPETKNLFAGRMVQFREQETNDLAKAFRFCKENDLCPDAVLGASGAREDHLLGNLSRFAEAAVDFPGCKLCTDYGYFCVFSGTCSFDASPGQQISLFSFDPGQKISSEGLKYPLNDLQLPWWHCGTLNEITSGKIHLKCSTDTPVLIFFANTGK